MKREVSIKMSLRKKQKRKRKEEKQKKNEMNGNPSITLPENANLSHLIENEISVQNNFGVRREVIKHTEFSGKEALLNSKPSCKLLKTKKLSIIAGDISHNLKNHQSGSIKKIIIEGKQEIESPSETRSDNIKQIDSSGCDTVKEGNPSSGTSTENNESKFITINNSKFTSVPRVLDITDIKNFPLYNQETRNNQISMCDIISIGMFDGGYEKLPSVRKILEETMPLPNKNALEKWKAKMIKELGEDGFQTYRQATLDQGKLLHRCIQLELSGMFVDTEQIQPISGFWKSLKHILPNVSDITVLESRLIHPYLYYQGAVDCVASYKGMPVLIEWKTSQKPKLSLKSMFDDPLQVAAYLGALNFDSNYRLTRPIESAILVVAYNTGLPAHMYILQKRDCEHYWRMWCARLAQFWNLLSVTSR